MVKGQGSQKRNLVVMDNLVLDYGEYGLLHPGGRFVLEANIGRDISKFFYGGYSMVNSPGQDFSHRHSQNALKIAKKMVIGVLENQATVTTQQMQVVDRNIQINSKINSFCF